MNGDLARIQPFEFKGTQLMLCADQRGHFVAFAPVCTALGVTDIGRAWADLLKRDYYARHIRVEYGPDGEAVRFLKVEAFPQWIANLESAVVAPHLRAKHTAWADDIVSAVYSYATKGVAIKEGTPLVAVLKEVGEFALKLNPSEKTRILVASAIESELARLANRNAASEMPVTVASRIQERGIKLTQNEVISVGAHMAKEYRRRTGKEPGSFPQWIDGAQRFVKSYTTADLPLLDAVIDAFVKKYKNPSAPLRVGS